MTSERTQQTTKSNRGRVVLRRAVALASMLALTVPALITTVAEPAGATTNFNVPALVNPSVGYDTGYNVVNRVTLTATGLWSQIGATCPTNCWGPNGTGGPLPGENQANWLVPNGSALALAGRIGSSGPWTIVGSGPFTLNGTGRLYMAMNDRLPSYGDNTGSLSVTVADPLQLSTQYFAEGPVLAGTQVEWEGTVENPNGFTHHNALATVSVGAPFSGTPTWTNFSAESSGNCSPSEVGDVYFCYLGNIPAGGTAIVDATADTQQVRPGTINDSFVVSSDESGTDAVATVAAQDVDGLRFDVLAPDSIGAGNVLSLTTTVTNTSATQTIDGIVVHGGIDPGTFHSGPPGCTVDNGSESGATIDCPSEGSFSLPPGASVDGTTTVNTDGLTGEDIVWFVRANSPDIGGDTYTESGSVPVIANSGTAPPTVSIITPANNAKLGQTNSYNFRANASPAAGQAIDYVDLQIDSGPRAIEPVPPYQVTIAPNQLSPGAHTLKATAHSNNGQTAFASVTVHVAAPPSVAIVPPPGFTQLDTAKTFKSSAAPGAGAPGVTIVSVTYAVDGANIGTTTIAPYSKVVDPASRSLDAGTHTLTATATDSTGQTTTSADFNFTVPQATLQIAPTTPPIVDSVTANGDAAWPVQVRNTSGVVAHHVRLIIDVSATAPNSTTTDLPFDLGAINGGLNLPATTPTCRFIGESTSFVCNLPDIPANSSLSAPFRIFVTTNGVVTGSTIAGQATATAVNADNVSGALGTVNVISCGSQCVIGVAAPGDPFASSPDAPTPANPTKQVITLSSGTAGGPPLPALTVTLSSINPNQATDPNDAKLCPTASGAAHCSGQISSVVANFGAYVNKKNPIRVTIITRWGSSIPAGRILMEEETGGDPIFLVPCEVDSVTREFNVPCVLPEIVHGTSAAGNLTTYNSILFVANDVHFARRLADGTVIYIDPPAAPTNAAATPTPFGAKVTWKAPTVTNGAAVTGYVVTAISGGQVKKTVTLNSAVLTTTVTGLTAGTTYGFRVVAKNVAGPGPPSAISNLVKPISPPAAPTGVTATAGAGQATVRWTAPTVTNGGAVTGYTVTVWSAGSLIRTMPSTTALTLTVTGLNRGQNYGFKVAAKNAAGLGPASAFSNIIKPT